MLHNQLIDIYIQLSSLRWQHLVIHILELVSAFLGNVYSPLNINSNFHKI